MFGKQDHGNLAVIAIGLATVVSPIGCSSNRDSSDHDGTDGVKQRAPSTDSSTVSSTSGETGDDSGTEPASDTSTDVELDTATDTLPVNDGGQEGDTNSDIDTGGEVDSGPRPDTDGDTGGDSQGDSVTADDADSAPEDDAGTADAGADTDSMFSPPEVGYVLDPYGYNPLVAMITFRDDTLVPEDVAQIRITVRGQSEGDEDFTETLFPQTEAYQTNFDLSDMLDADVVGIPVLGLYPGFENQVDFEILTAAAAFTGSVTIPTETIGFTETEIVTVDIFNRDAMEPGWTHINNRVYDHAGRLRWFAGIPGASGRINHVKESGFILSWVLDERTVMGKRIYDRSATLPGNFYEHHDAVEIPNGNIISCVGDNDTVILHADGTEEISKSDSLVELDAVTNDIVNRWDIRYFLDVDRYTLANPRPDWAHMNTVWYDDFDDSIIISNRYQGVLKVTRNGIQGPDTNEGKELVWIFAPHLDWGQAGWDGQGPIDPNDYLLTAVNSEGLPYNEEVQNNLAAPDPSLDDFHWPVGQHGLRITHREEGIVHLMLFNNFASTLFDGPGTINNALKSDLSNDRSDERYSLLVVYEIDEVAMTVRQIWSYGKNDLSLFGSFASGIDLFKATENRFVISIGVDSVNARANPMNPQAVELTPEGEVVFHLQIDNTTMEAYRGGRIELYHPER